jgi:hypothetical protein
MAGEDSLEPEHLESPEVARAGTTILMNALAEEPISEELLHSLGEPAKEALVILRETGLLTAEEAGPIRATRAARLADSWTI